MSGWEGRASVGEGVLVEDEFVPEVLEVLVGEVEAFGAGEVAGRGEERIEGEPECVFEQGGDDAFEDGAVGLEAGVGVDLDEPGLPVAVDHEVQPEELEVVAVALRVEVQVVGGDDVHCHLLHGCEDVALEVVALVGEGEVEVALELGVGQLVARLVLLVVLAVLLHRVVGEVHEPAEVLQVELLAAGADVALAVPVGLEGSPHAGQQHVVAQVELAVVVEQRAADVGLDDVGEVLPVLVLLAAHALLHSAEGAQLDRLPPVAVLPRLHDPQPPRLPAVLLQEGLELRRVPRPHVVGLGQEVEGVLAGHVPVVEEQRPEEVFLGADGLVARQVVGHHVSRKGLLEGDAEALAADVVLHQRRLLLAQDLPVERHRLLADLGTALGREQGGSSGPAALLAGEDLVEPALRPEEGDAGLVDAAGELPPEPAFEDAPDEGRVVALADEGPALGAGGGVVVADVEVGVEAVGEVDLEEELEVVADLAAVAHVALVHAQLEAHLPLRRLRGLRAAAEEGPSGLPAHLHLLLGEGLVENCAAADDRVGRHEGAADVLPEAVGGLVARVALHLQQRLLALAGALFVPELAAVELLVQLAAQAQELVPEVELAAELPRLPLLLVAPQHVLDALHYDRELPVLLPALAPPSLLFPLLLRPAEALLAGAVGLVGLAGTHLFAGVVEELGVGLFFFVAVAAVALLVACGQLATVLVDVARRTQDEVLGRLLAHAEHLANFIIHYKPCRTQSCALMARPCATGEGAGFVCLWLWLLV